MFPYLSGIKNNLSNCGITAPALNNNGSVAQIRADLVNLQANLSSPNCVVPQTTRKLQLHEVTQAIQTIDTLPPAPAPAPVTTPSDDVAAAGETEETTE